MSQAARSPRFQPDNEVQPKKVMAVHVHGVSPLSMGIPRDQNLSPNQQLFEGATPETT